MANTEAAKELKLKVEEDSNENEKVFTFGKSNVKATNLNKIYFPEDGITKGDVINYYISMADYILPYLNNLGCIEINPWHSTVNALDKPDYLIIDIDPSEKNTFDQVIETANVVKQVLDKAGAISFCKTSGASGLHVYVPTAKKYTYEKVKDFAYIVCMMASKELKDFTTLERNLQKRGNKHIYMDYLQNRKGQTIASVYSLRPKPGATVSAPLLWEEVKKGLLPKQFTIHNMKQWVQKNGDIFKGVLGKGIDLKKCLKKMGA
jgi:bifunctional non-homologous end joining protein LigD